MDNVDRIYNTKKEWTKDIKFNNQWFHLKSIYDMDDKPDEFDFNSTLADGEFDFNSTPQDVEYVLDPDSIEISEPEYDDIDFNAIYESRKEATKYGCDKLVDVTTTYGEEFEEFYNSINQYHQKPEKEMFYIEAGLLIKDANDEIIADTDNTDIADISIDKIKEALGTILKRGGGYSNEATMEIVMGLDTSTDTNNILCQLGKLEDANNIPNMANRFPDAIFIGSTNPDISAGKIIPIDLKVSYNGKYNTASADNMSYVSGIYAALVNTINHTEQGQKPSLLKFIKDTPIGTYKAGNDTNYDFYNIKADNAPRVMPELKGFLLYSQTFYDPKKRRLVYNGFEITPMIACMKPNRQIPGLFSSKRGGGQDSVSYSSEDGTLYEAGILKGLPINFATTIKAFYEKLSDPDTFSQYKNYIVKQLRDNENDVTKNADAFKANIQKICKAIGIITDEIKDEEDQAKAEKLEDQKNENTQWIIEQYQSKILSKYGLVECFKSINEDDEFSDVSKDEQKEIQSATAKSLANLEKADKSKASTIASKLKEAFQKHGKKYFLAACVALSLLSGNASATTANQLQRLNSGTNRPVQILNDLTPNGGIEIEKTIVNQFVFYNFSNVDELKANKVKTEIMNILKENPNSYLFITNNHETINDLAQTIKKSKINVIKSVINKEHPNKQGKYQALVIAEL